MIWLKKVFENKKRLLIIEFLQYLEDLVLVVTLLRRRIMRRLE